MAEFVDLNTKRAFENHILEAKGRTNKTAKAYTKAKAKKEKKRGGLPLTKDTLWKSYTTRLRVRGSCLHFTGLLLTQKQIKEAIENLRKQLI